MSKGTMLFMTSQIRPHKTILYCNKDLERDKQYQAEISTPEQVSIFKFLFFKPVGRHDTHHTDTQH
jgi:hypothetical protein